MLRHLRYAESLLYRLFDLRPGKFAVAYDCLEVLNCCRDKFLHYVFCCIDHDIVEETFSYGRERLGVFCPTKVIAQATGGGLW